VTSREDGAAAAGGGRFPAARGRAAALAVAVVCALVNLPSVRPGFIHDDHRIIEQNERIRGLELLPQVVSTGYWMPGDVAGPSLYRPITLLTFTLNHSMGGLRPFGYRVVDLLLHVLNSMLVFRLAGRPAGGAGGVTPAPVPRHAAPRRSAVRRPSGAHGGAG